jgi:hypothetical protein
MVIAEDQRGGRAAAACFLFRTRLAVHARPKAGQCPAPGVKSHSWAIPRKATRAGRKERMSIYETLQD